MQSFCKMLKEWCSSFVPAFPKKKLDHKLLKEGCSNFVTAFPKKKLDQNLSKARPEFLHACDSHPMLEVEPGLSQDGSRLYFQG